MSREEVKDSREQYHKDYYAGEVSEYHDTPIPTFLKYVYFILPIWGLFWFWLYWNGSQGWLDRGYWSELADAANTKVVIEKRK